MKVLVSSGGTEEAIDGVRCLSNSSTGRTGAVLTDYFCTKGAEVTLLRQRKALKPSAKVKEILFQSYDDLFGGLKNRLESDNFDAVIHLAAVSDYRVDSIEVDGRPFPAGGPGKMSSGGNVLIKLRPTEKILKRLKTWSLNPRIIIIGFKLSDKAGGDEIPALVGELFDNGDVDYVIHNDSTGIGEHNHHAGIWSSDALLAETGTKEEMADVLYRLCGGEEL